MPSLPALHPRRPRAVCQGGGRRQGPTNRSMTPASREVRGARARARASTAWGRADRRETEIAGSQRGVARRASAGPMRTQALSRAASRLAPRAESSASAPRHLGPDPDLVRCACASLRRCAALYRAHLSERVMAQCSEMASCWGFALRQCAESTASEATRLGRPCYPARRRAAGPLRDTMIVMPGPNFERLFLCLLKHCPKNPHRSKRTS